MSIQKHQAYITHLNFISCTKSPTFLCVLHTIVAWSSTDLQWH